MERLRLATARLQQPRNRRTTQYQPAHSEPAPAHLGLRTGTSRGQKAGTAGCRNVQQRRSRNRHPCECPTRKSGWPFCPGMGLPPRNQTNMGTAEHVIKKPSSHSFDKLGEAASNSPPMSAATAEKIGLDSESVAAIHTVGGVNPRRLRTRDPAGRFEPFAAMHLSLCSSRFGENLQKLS
jgi:hypothetical protein